MSDVNTFIETIGKDVSANVAPRIEGLAKGIEAAALSDYVPKISAFANQLVKDIITEQSVTVRDFVTELLQDLFKLYKPEVAGNLRTKIVNSGIEVHGQDVRLDLRRRDTGAIVSSLDIPISLRIQVDGVSLNVTESTIGLDVVR
jgi:hypothetical protein